MVRSTPVLRRAFTIASTVWALMLPLAAYAASRPHASPILYGFATAVYGIGSVVCHQLSVRSFHLFAVQMPVCARCTGIYAGAAVASLVLSRGARGARAVRSEDGFAAIHAENGNRSSSASSASVAVRVSHERLRPPSERVISVRSLAAVSGAPRVALFLALSPTIATLAYEWASGLAPANWIRAVAGVALGAVVSWLVVRHSHDARPSS
jgi:hypothetical protein